MRRVAREAIWRREVEHSLGFYRCFQNREVSLLTELGTHSAAAFEKCHQVFEMAKRFRGRVWDIGREGGPGCDAEKDRKRAQKQRNSGA